MGLYSIYRDFIGIMEKNMETIILRLQSRLEGEWDPQMNSNATCEWKERHKVYHEHWYVCVASS